MSTITQHSFTAVSEDDEPEYFSIQDDYNGWMFQGGGLILQLDDGTRIKISKYNIEHKTGPISEVHITIPVTSVSHERFEKPGDDE